MLNQRRKCQKKNKRDLLNQKIWRPEIRKENKRKKLDINKEFLILFKPVKCKKQMKKIKE